MPTATPDGQNNRGLIWAVVLDGQGGSRPLDWAGVRAWSAQDGPLWVHLNRTQDESRYWLEHEAGIAPAVSEALLAEETRPRSVLQGDGLLVILRGVNCNAGADPEDMVSIRLWIDANRVLTLRQRTVMAVRDIREHLESGVGPKNTGAFLVQLASNLLDRAGPVLNDLEEDLDALEERVVANETAGVRGDLAAVRRQVVALRRYLAPQREALARLYQEPVTWLDAAHRMGLREDADQVTRYVEDLDAARERAVVTQDELSNRLAEHMNHTMYVLSLVAAVFLPLGLLTGLLGINVGGIPGTDNPWAFLVVCGLLGGIAGVLLLLFRRLRWL